MDPDAIEVRKAYLVTKVDTPPEGEGRFSAIVSVFGNVDSQGDVIDKGAFAATLDDLAASGRSLPILWSHDYYDPDSIIGEAEVVKETDVGLYVEGVLDIDDNPRAAQVYRQMSKGRLREFSIGGMVREWAWVEPADGADVELHITKLDLWECGPCFKGSILEIELLSVESRLAKDQPPANHVDSARVDIIPEPEPPRPEISPSTQAVLGLMTLPN